jgi:hypothetical protein
MAQLEQTTQVLARLGPTGDDARRVDDGVGQRSDQPVAEVSTQPKRALKFLASERLAPFSRTRWPAPDAADRWISADNGRPGHAAVYACTVEQAPFWLNDELWIVELDGVIERTERKVSARRGRLVEPVTAWNERARVAFGESCLEVARTAAVEALRETQPEEANAFAERALDAALMKDAATLADTALDPSVRATCSYLAVGLEVARLPASAAFVAAVAVGHVRGPSGAAIERERQAAWLRDKLELGVLLAGGGGTV